MDDPASQASQATGSMLEAAAAHLCGNSSKAWDSTYDDHMKTRAIGRVLALYPSFQQWVQAQAAQARAQLPRNPLQS